MMSMLNIEHVCSQLVQCSVRSLFDLPIIFNYWLRHSNNNEIYLCKINFVNEMCDLCAIITSRSVFFLLGSSFWKSLGFNLVNCRMDRTGVTSSTLPERPESTDWLHEKSLFLLLNRNGLTWTLFNLRPNSSPHQTIEFLSSLMPKLY